MDPIRRLSGLEDLIYQHMEGSEVLKMSKVSRSWYQSIGRSEVCMEKIDLAFVVASPFEPSTSVIQSVLASKRRYTHLSFSRPFFCNNPMCLKVLEKFAGDVQELKISWAVGTIVDEMFKEPVAFPQLKFLEVGYHVSLKLMESLFYQSQLTSLHITQSTPKILNMALKVPTLKRLKIDVMIQDRFYYSPQFLTPNLSIEVLSVKGDLGYKTLSLLTCTPNLKKLSLSGCGYDQTLQFVQHCFGSNILSNDVEVTYIHSDSDNHS